MISSFATEHYTNKGDSKMDPKGVLTDVRNALKSVKVLTVNTDALQMEYHAEQGKTLLSKGQKEGALTAFFAALTSAGKDKRLQGLALINIGDLMRRVGAHTDTASADEFLKVAGDIFSLARPRLTEELDVVRLDTMEAMVHIAPTEMGRVDPEGVKTHISLLEQAIALAKKVFYNSLSLLERREQAKQAWSLALHRLSGTVLGGTFARNFSLANREQKKQCLAYIEELLTSGVPTAEEARLKANRAMYSFSEEPFKAFQTGKAFEECAKLIEPSSPVDAFVYYTYAAAAPISFQPDCVAECLHKAESLLPAYQKYIGNKVTEDLKLFLSLQEQLKK